MRHHTKDKGDKGVGFVLADLLSKGIQVALPLSEHLPFDCIAISEAGEMRRISIKYRTMVDGGVKVHRRSSWADGNGVHTRKHARGDYDAFAIYCPDTKKCYYVRESEVPEVITLRVVPSRRTGRLDVKPAENYEDPSLLFAPARGP